MKLAGCDILCSVVTTQVPPVYIIWFKYHLSNYMQIPTLDAASGASLNWAYWRAYDIIMTPGVGAMQELFSLIGGLKILVGLHCTLSLA